MTFCCVNQELFSSEECDGDEDNDTGTRVTRPKVNCLFDAGLCRRVKAKLIPGLWIPSWPETSLSCNPACSAMTNSLRKGFALEPSSQRDFLFWKKPRALPYLLCPHSSQAVAPGSQQKLPQHIQILAEFTGAVPFPLSAGWLWLRGVSR